MTTSADLPWRTGDTKPKPRGRPRKSTTAKKPTAKRTTRSAKQINDEARAKGTTTRAKKQQSDAAKRKAQEAAQAKRAKERADKKAKMEAEAKAKQTSGMRKLTPVAKEINTRFIKASKLDDQADDHRLAAALRIAEAKEVCKDSGIKFKDWAEANITEQSYETVRKLAAVGASENPALALADMRGKNKEANKEHRERKKLASRDTTPAGPKVGPVEAAEAALKALGDKGEVNVMEARAAKHGMSLVPQTATKKLQALEEGYGKIDVAQEAFNALKPSDKMKFLNWAAREVGATLDTTPAPTPKGRSRTKKTADAGNSDAGDMPEFLKRGKQRTTRRRASA